MFIILYKTLNYVLKYLLCCPITPPPEQPKGLIYVGRFKFIARTAEELSFEKGERLMVIDRTEGDWWMVRSLLTLREGYIPCNQVALLKSYEAEEYVMLYECHMTYRWWLCDCISWIMTIDC